MVCIRFVFLTTITKYIQNSSIYQSKYSLAKSLRKVLTESQNGVSFVFGRAGSNE